MQKILLIVFLFSLFGCKNSTAQTGTKLAFPNSSFSAPVDIQSPNDGSGRLFIVSQSGEIHFVNINNPEQAAQTFLDINDKVLYGGEQGLLGLAFHPQFPDSSYFFVNYVSGSPRRTVIAKYTISAADPNTADPESELVILEIEQPYSNHNGGQIAFGPNDYLYIGMGDGGSGGDPGNRAQNPKSLLGKILRIDVSSSTQSQRYTIPEDNPFNNNTNYSPEIYATGMRNPWRFSFDPETGKLWCGDVGQGDYEKVDIIESGKNYGWRIMEGFHCYNPKDNCDQTGLVLPVHEYGHNSEGGYSITGGYVYRGSSAPSLNGKYIYADYVSGNIWVLSKSGENYSNELLFGSEFSIPTFGTDENNELYFSSFSDGRIYKFDDNIVDVKKKP